MTEKFKQHLRNAGHKVTAPRLEVFCFFQKRDLTTVSALLSGCNRADRASIYRAIALFRKLGVIHDVVSGGKRMIELTDSFTNHHHHIYCLKCGKSEAVANRKLESDLDMILRKSGFRAVSHQIEIDAICPECQDE